MFIVNNHHIPVIDEKISGWIESILMSLFPEAIMIMLSVLVWIEFPLGNSNWQFRGDR